MSQKSFKSKTRGLIKIKPTKKRSPNIKKKTPQNISSSLRIYRKTISNLKIRECIIQSFLSEYTLGPTIIWTEDADDLSIFTVAESYDHFIGFESPFSNPRSPKFLKKIIRKMCYVKGTILIKESTPACAMHIPVHFCAYRVDSVGILTIFDPSWHSADPGIYSTTAFYESLDAFGVSYKHAEPKRRHHWQSLLPNDVFCQTWTLQWLLFDGHQSFPLPLTRKEAADHIAKYIIQFSSIVASDVAKYMNVFPVYKLEGNNPVDVFRSILSNRALTKTIYDLF